MKTRITLPLLLIFFTSSAQTYHPLLGNNVVWKVWATYTFISSSGTETYSTSTDTTIGGLTYTKIVDFWGNPTFMREDSAARKVYAIVHTGGADVDKLIYDFSLNLNDSIHLAWIDGYQFGTPGMNGYYKVDSVATISTLAGPRKYMQLSNNGYNVQEWIEGIGVLDHYVNYPQDYCDLYDCYVGHKTFCQTRNGIETYERTPTYVCDSGLVYDCSVHISYAHVDSNYTFSARIQGMGPYIYHWTLWNADSNPSVLVDTSFYPSANFVLLRNHRYNVFLYVNDTSVCNTSGYRVIHDTSSANTSACNAFFWAYPDTIPGNYFVVDYSTGSNLSYLWDFGDGTTSTLQFPSHQYSTPNRYTVCLTVDDGNGCISTYCDSSFYNINKTGGGPMSVLNVVNNGITGIKKPDDARMMLYPNPAQDEVLVQLPADVKLKNARFTLYDLLGKEVLTVAINDRRFRIDVSSLTRGYYFYQVTNEGGVAGAGKVVVR